MTCPWVSEIGNQAFIAVHCYGGSPPPLHRAVCYTLYLAASSPHETLYVISQGGPSAFFRGIGPRALSNGINSAVFFAFFELLRTTFKQRAAEKAAAAAAVACEGSRVDALSTGTRKRGNRQIEFGALRGLGTKAPQAPAGLDGHALQSTA